MSDAMTEEERRAQRRYIALALSGRGRKVPRMLEAKKQKLPSTLPWS